MDINELSAKLAQYGQEHLIQFWSELNEDERKRLYHDLNGVNFGLLTNGFRRAMENSSNAVKLDGLLQPVPVHLQGSVERCSNEQLAAYELEGLKQISAGKVAVLLLAGGQGTRLGVSYPKGMYNVGLPSAKTLYQLQAERIRKIEELAAAQFGQHGTVPWYIMTSEHTVEPTKRFFAKHHFFGLQEDNIVFFEQNVIPCVDVDGKVILEDKHKIATAPDGNGGLYRALSQNGVIPDMDRRGIEFIHVYCVDNILVKMADPVFVGFCLEKNANCGAKVVKKASPDEPVGVICQVNGVYQVVEYSEISSETANRRNPDGELTFNAGNICNHFFSKAFLKTLILEHEQELIYHIAKKKIPFIDSNGVRQNPAAPNGIKMEKFVFDVFQFSTAPWAKGNFAVWEVLREEEFSPLKNGDGAPKDTPTTSRGDLLNLHAKFALQAGAKLGKAEAKNGASNGHAAADSDQLKTVVEISPLVSYFGEGLTKLLGGKELNSTINIERDPASGQPKIIILP